jgi:hypothetical protein
VGANRIVLPAGRPLCVPNSYKTEIACTGALLETVLWEKTADREAIYGDPFSRSAPYRWCEQSGSNALEGRSDFTCTQDASRWSVFAPMCAAGRFEVCATPIFRCPNGKAYRGAPTCKTVAVTKVAK